MLYGNNQRDGDKQFGALDAVAPERRSDMVDARIIESLKVSLVERVEQCKLEEMELANSLVRRSTGVTNDKSGSSGICDTSPR